MRYNILDKTMRLLKSEIRKVASISASTFLLKKHEQYFKYHLSEKLFDEYSFFPPPFRLDSLLNSDKWIYAMYNILIYILNELI